MQKNEEVVEECGVGHVAVDDWKRTASDVSEWYSASASLGKGVKGRMAIKKCGYGKGSEALFLWITKQRFWLPHPLQTG